MSSRKTAATKNIDGRSETARAEGKPPRPGQPVTAVPAPAEGAHSQEAKELAAAIEKAVQQGELDVLSPPAVQALIASLCKLYSAQVEGGRDFPPLAARQSASPTEIMTTTSALLKAANLAVFELGMWQSWTGR